jgi:hypothetical protein
VYLFQLTFVTFVTFQNCCGALCIIAAGTTAQPLVATLFQMFYLLIVLKAAPFDSDGDDQSAFVSAFSLTLTMLCGFAVMSNPSKLPVIFMV